MFRLAPLLPISLTLCCLGFVLALLSVGGELVHHPTHAEWRQAIVKAAAAHIPIDATSCGMVELREDASNAQACVKAAMAKGSPFWVLSQARGEDSIVWSLLLGDGTANYRAVEFDSYGWEKQGHPSFTSREVSCSSPLFGQAQAAVWCNRR